MNFQMLKQAQELKRKLDQAQKELDKMIIEADSGHGAVKVTVNGQQKVLSVKIEPKAIDSNKPERLEELVTTAVNEAMEKSTKAATTQLSALTGGLKIPGLT